MSVAGPQAMTGTYCRSGGPSRERTDDAVSSRRQSRGGGPRRAKGGDTPGTRPVRNGRTRWAGLRGPGLRQAVRNASRPAGASRTRSPKTPVWGTKLDRFSRISTAVPSSQRSYGSRRGAHDDPHLRRTPRVHIDKVRRAISATIANRNAGQAGADIRKIIRPVVMHEVAMGRTVDRQGRSRAPQHTEHRNRKPHLDLGVQRRRPATIAQVTPSPDSGRCRRKPASGLGHEGSTTNRGMLLPPPAPGEVWAPADDCEGGRRQKPAPCDNEFITSGIAPQRLTGRKAPAQRIPGVALPTRSPCIFFEKRVAGIMAPRRASHERSRGIGRKFVR